MPFVNVKLVEGVFSEEQKHAMAADLTDVMVKHEGSEAFRDVVWVLIEELHTDGWHIGGAPFRGPKSLMQALEHAKETYEAIDGVAYDSRGVRRGRAASQRPGLTPAQRPDSSAAVPASQTRLGFPAGRVASATLRSEGPISRY